jgi:hypothetical protein
VVYATSTIVKPPATSALPIDVASGALPARMMPTQRASAIAAHVVHRPTAVSTSLLTD